MKLHLPKMLTAALLAAITAVGSSAFAGEETSATFTTVNSTTTSASNFWANGFTCTLTGARLTTTSDPTGVPIAGCETVTLKSVTSNIRGSAAGGTGLALVSSTGEVLSLATNSASGAGNFTWTFTDATVSTNSALYFVYYDASNAKMEVGYTVRTGDGGDLYRAGASTLRNHGNTTNYTTCAFLGDSKNLNLTPQNSQYAPYLSIVTTGTAAASDEYVWAGTESGAAWDTKTQNWTIKDAPAYYKSAEDTIVIFGTDAAAKAVTVSENILAGEVSVNDSYTFAVSDTGSLTVASMTVAAGKKLTLDGVGTTSISNLTNNGEIAINKDARLALDTVTASNTDLGTITTGEGTLAIETVVISGGNGKITFENATDNGTVQLTGGKVIYGGETEHAVQNLRLSQTGQQVSTVDVLEGATLHIEGTLVGKDQASRMNGSFSLSHWSAANVVNVYGTLISDVVVSSCDGTGTINVYEGGRLEMRDGLNRGNYNDNAITINVAGGATLATGTTYNTDETKNSDTMIVSLADGATLEAYYKGAATTANIAKAMTLGGVTVKTGDSGKTLTLSGALTANGTIAQTGEGALVLAGAIDITGNTGELGERYVGGQTDGNGFLESSGLITIYTGDNVTLDEAAVITYHGDNVTADVHEGKYTVAATVDYSAFYVRSGSELISTALTHPEVGSVVLSADTTINMDAATSMAVAVVEGADNTTIAATEDVTITSLAGLTDGKTLTISAAGHEVALQGDNTFRGNLVVDKGILKLDTGDRKKVLGEFNGNHAKGQAAPAPDKTITINEGGTIDLNGKSDLSYVYTLNGGSLVNTGGAIGANSMQTVGLILTEDSTIGGTSNFFLLGAGFDNTFATLNGRKLTKTGANSIGFRNTNVTSGTIEVKEGNIEFIDGENSLLAANIILNGGSISGTVRVDGEISVTAEQESTLNGLAVRSGQVDLIGTVNVSGSSLDLSNADQSTGTLRVSDGSVLNANSTLWLCSTSKIEVEEGGTFNIAGLSITAPSEDALITSDSNDYYGTGKANFTIANAAITATADVTIGNTLNNVTVDAGTHAVTLNSAAVSVSVGEGGSISVGENGSVGEMTLEDGGIISGYVKAGEGDAVINTPTGTASLGDVIDLRAGTLTLMGNYDISGLYGVFDVTGYEKGGSEFNGNGYGIEEGTVTVVTIAPEVATLVTTGATFAHGTSTVTMNDETGVAAVSGVNYANYYINNDHESLSTAKQHAELASIKVAEGATLVVDGAMGTSLLAAESTGTVSINTGVVVTVDSAAPAVKLAGTGTYATGSNLDLGDVELGDDWHGAVSLGGFAFSNTSLTDLWKGDSWVEMNGITGGYLSAWNGGGSESANIRLTNPGEDNDQIAWKWNEGTSKAGVQPTITFDGKWEGDGTFKLTDRRENVTFAGDISGWEGTFDYSGNHGSTLTFKDAATVINAAIENNGVNDATDAEKQLHIAVENEAVFNKEVASHTLTIADDASATFHQAEMELASLTLGDDAATMTVWSDEQAAAEGTVTITETLTAGEGSILHSNLDLKDGVVLAFNDTLTMTSTLGVEGMLTLDEDSALFLELLGLPEGSGQWVDLIMAGDGSNLVYTNPGLHRANAADVFTNTLFKSGDYMVFATKDSFGITRVPEPTTGTLSLLALMALAARRRRH
ncbi:MAG: hypothetical protein MJ058_02375 [Akkermansia sp.]|nr:hypothetical protein [Akkermansia sp.]